MAATTANTTWASPATWATGDALTQTNMNAEIRDKLNALKTPASFYYVVNEGADYTTSSASFADVDATSLSATITTGGGMVLVGFHGTVSNSGTVATFFDLLVDGAAHAGDDGIIYVVYGSAGGPVGFTRLITGLSAGSHTFKLRWKVASSTSTLHAGAGTSGKDVHPQFWGYEIG